MRGRFHEESLGAGEEVQSAPSGYIDFFEHLSEELSLLRLCLAGHLRRLKADGAEAGETKGIFISEEEIVSILSAPGTREEGAGGYPEGSSLDSAIQDGSQKIAGRLAASGLEVEQFPLLRIARIFGLSSFDMRILVMALAPEVDRRFERIYAYLNDDMSKRSPSIGLAFALFSPDLRQRAEAWHSLSPEGPLRAFGLVTLSEDGPDAGFMSRRFRLTGSISRYLASGRTSPPRASGIARFCQPDNTKRRIREPREEVRRMKDFLVSGEQANRRPVFWLYGKGDEEKRTAVSVLCGELGLPFLTVDIEGLLNDPDQERHLRELFRDAAVLSAPLFITGGDLLAGGDDRSSLLRRNLLGAMGDLSWITMIGAESLWFPNDPEGRFDWYPLEFTKPGFRERRAIWGSLLEGSGLPGEEADVLAGRFNMGEDQIRDVVSLATKSSPDGRLTSPALLDACRKNADRRLALFSRKVSHHFSWDDIVLPKDRMRQLREICGHMKHRHRVFYAWGFDERLSLGKGLNILFSGTSGTGKTMAADIIAGELNLDLYKVDLSTIVSKYIGETEKNLGQIFREASSGNLILFFDEADALFGKRSEVKDSHDRYANIEINYLLQKMEEHEGVVILATNLSRNLDEAFLRRMQFTVEFPFPDEQHREKIWNRIFPPQAPHSGDFDLPFLAARFRLAGGNIKNVALAAAFLAAEESAPIGMRHLILAVKREMQKMGKLCVKGDFGKYYELIEGEEE